MTRRDRSIDAAWFDAQYAANPDPWDFATSDYEREKYAATLAALPAERRFARAFEAGCSIGVFTEMLAPRCDALLACDVSEAALAAARIRCAGLPVRLERRVLPRDWPEGRFDLLVFSEILYYFDRSDLSRTASLARNALSEDGLVLLVHYLGGTDYPLTGDEAADSFLKELGLAMRLQRRSAQYRLDLAGRR